MALSLAWRAGINQTSAVRRSVLGLVRASHPEPAAAVTTAAALLALGVGLDLSKVVASAAAVLASQLAIGWTNDWLDAGRDAQAGRSDKPIPTGAVGRRSVGVAGLVASGITVPLALMSGVAAAIAAAIALASAQLYNWPVKLTAFSVLPYMVSFGMLPAFVVLAKPGSPAPPGWLVAAGALLGGGAHFANVLPDLADDARTGVRGLPHRIGPARSRLAAAVLLLAATVTLAFGPPGPPSWAGLAAVALAVVVLQVGWYADRSAAVRGGRTVALFRAAMAVAVIDVVMLIASGRLV
jgi:4-hydroxybenzoate polyprenyltransferase